MAQISKQKRSPRRKLRIHMRNPIPTIYPESLVKDMPSVLPNLTPLRKAPTKRIFRPDEINSTSYKNLEVKHYSQLNESTLQYLAEGYLFSNNLQGYFFGYFDRGYFFRYLPP